MGGGGEEGAVQLEALVAEVKGLSGLVDYRTYTYGRSYVQNVGRGRGTVPRGRAWRTNSPMHSWRHFMT